MTLEDINAMLKAAEAYRDIKLLQLQRTNEYLIKLQRQKWWLSNPEVAYFTARTEWDTAYSHPEWKQELCFYVESIVDIYGLNIERNTLHPLFFYGFNPLDTEVSHDGAVTTYKNPFLYT